MWYCSFPSIMSLLYITVVLFVEVLCFRLVDASIDLVVLTIGLLLLLSLQ